MCDVFPPDFYISDIGHFSSSTALLENKPIFMGSGKSVKKNPAQGNKLPVVC